MINKRQLILNLLAHNDESSFYDKKEKLNLSEKEGKAKFLKHICALSNANPYNNSYILIGVSDQHNELKGTSFFDDSKIQNLVNAYLLYPPIVRYENIEFPHLDKESVIGLVTISSQHSQWCQLNKKIWKYPKNTIFIRKGSISLPYEDVTKLRRIDTNASIVHAIEKKAFGSMKLTLDGVVNFMQYYKDFDANYLVFKEYFVVCWAGKKIPNDTNSKNNISKKDYYTRVDIQLINEQVKLFYSELDQITLRWNSDDFIITEYVNLYILNETYHIPLEQISIKFKENASYEIQEELLFRRFEIDVNTLDTLVKNCKKLHHKIINTIESLSLIEQQQALQLPDHCLIAYASGYNEMKEILKSLKNYFKSTSITNYNRYRSIRRILRKINYY